MLNAVKRKVGLRIRYREPLLLEGGTDWLAESGLGAMHRLRICV